MSEESAMPSASDHLLSSSREYGLYVNKTRHIPNFADGLKDAMRKALYVMKSKGRTKTAALSGAMTDALLYAHGDASGSVNSLAAPFGNNVPLLKALGNFGTRLGPDEFSAPRYTEVEKPSYATELIYTDFDILPMEPNYDGSTVQPVTLLPPIPLLLLNGMTGIGVGWATSIFPRKPEEVIAAVLAEIDGTPMPKLKPHYNWCDAKVKSLGFNDNGGASWEFSGRVTVKDSSTLIVTDLPPMMKIEDFKRTLESLEEREKIQDYDDESSDTIRIVVRLKRGTAKDWSEEDAVDLLKLRSRETENFVVIAPDNKSIIHYTMKDGREAVFHYLSDWVKWRFGWYKARYEKLLADDSDELTYMKSIQACWAGQVPAQLRKIKDRAALVDEIKSTCKNFSVTPTAEHVSKIADLPIYRWTLEQMDKVKQRIEELEKLVAEHKSVLRDDKKRMGVFAGDVKAIVPSVARAISEVKETRDPK